MSHTSPEHGVRSPPAHLTVAFAAGLVVALSMAFTYGTVVATTRPMGLLSTSSMAFLFGASWAAAWLVGELAWNRRTAR